MGYKTNWPFIYFIQTNRDCKDLRVAYQPAFFLDLIDD